MLLLRPNEADERSILLLITSNRGLCGAVQRGRAAEACSEPRRQLTEAPALRQRWRWSARRASTTCVPRNRDLAETITDIEDHIAFERVSELAERYMGLYQAARNRPRGCRPHAVPQRRRAAARWSQVAPDRAAGSRSGAAAAAGPVRVFPAGRELLARLIPEAVKIRLFQCFNDAIVSEQVARMVAMKAATDAAGDMRQVPDPPIQPRASVTDYDGIGGHCGRGECSSVANEEWRIANSELRAANDE